ncbi:MAG TPA: ROK family protein, partial [Candidatus Sumerlaeota bacterium]|nr:ROK family protein [Candidatus Sumerlaeota bacterium]
MTDRPWKLGIDLGGTKILAAVIGPDNAILSRAKKKTKVELGAEAVLERIAQTAEEALQLASGSAEAIACAGIGAPGPLDPETGVVLEAPNLQWKEVALTAWLSERLGIPSYLSNDVNAGTWGEYVLGAGQGSRSCIGVFVGTGIGGGLVINGQLYDGASHIAGEIGHMCLDPNGPVCGCGRRGCLEAFASRTAMTRDLLNESKKRDREIPEVIEKGQLIRSKEFRKKLSAGDPSYVRVFEGATECLGRGLASVTNLLNPDCIILGGGVVEALGSAYVDRVREVLAAHAFPTAVGALRLVPAALGDDAGVLGAALL